VRVVFLSQIVYVDHDLVARHVYRHNHDAAYNPDLPNDDGGIEYVYYESFEQVHEQLDAIMKEHGRKFWRMQQFLGRKLIPN